MNVYSELLELLMPEWDGSAGGVFGTLTAISPLTVTVRGTKLTSGLFYPTETEFKKKDIGREVAHDFS